MQSTLREKGPLPIPTNHVPAAAYRIEPSSSSCWRGRLWSIVPGVISAAAGVTAVALLALNTSSTEEVLLPFAAGALIGNGLQMITARKVSNRYKDFLADYATPMFLIPTQVYNNLDDPSSSLGQAILGSLTALVGAGLASYVHTAVTRKPSESPERVPLKGKTEHQQTYLRMPCMNTKTSRIAWNVFKGTLGMAGAAVGFALPNLGILRDFSVLVAGEATGQLVSELWHKRISRIHREDQSAERARSAPVLRYITASKCFLGLSLALPGMTIDLAASLSGNKRWAGSTSLYLLTGALLGGIRNLNLLRFLEIPSNRLTELERFGKGGASQACSISKVAKWFFAGPLLAGFIGLGLAGFSFQTMDFEPVSGLDQAVLGTFLGAIYSSYAISSGVQRRFSIEEQGRWTNWAFFEFLYSPRWVFGFLYLDGKLRFGDRFLSSDSTAASVLTSIGYGLFAMGIASEAQGRGKFPSPRVPTPLFAGLGAQFFADRLLGRV